METVIDDDRNSLDNISIDLTDETKVLGNCR